MKAEDFDPSEFFALYQALQESIGQVKACIESYESAFSVYEVDQRAYVASIESASSDMALQAMTENSRNNTIRRRTRAHRERAVLSKSVADKERNKMEAYRSIGSIIKMMVNMKLSQP